MVSNLFRSLAVMFTLGALLVTLALSRATIVRAATDRSMTGGPLESLQDPSGHHPHDKPLAAPAATFARSGSLTVNTGENNLLSAVIDPTGGYAYFGTQTSPGKIVRVRLSDFTRNGSLTLNTGEDQLFAAVIDTTGGFAYFATRTSPSRIVKVRLSDLPALARLP